jgi:hypothetical protein
MGWCTANVCFSPKADICFALPKSAFDKTTFFGEDPARHRRHGHLLNNRARGGPPQQRRAHRSLERFARQSRGELFARE